MKKIILTIQILACFTRAFSQNSGVENPDSASFYNLSIEELLNVEISVASKKALSLRESPGIVTLITQDEIRNSGAHDLMEVLSLVPGLHFGVDVQGVVGIGIRGNWGHEGKVLLLYDGQEMNEQLFSSVQFGEHDPIDQVKKIEIIRGPGSSMYGVNAEYAVINIITNNNPEYQGLSAAASYGQMQRTTAARSISINGGKHFGDLAVNVGVYSGEGNRSDRIFNDYAGNSFDMASKSRLRNCLLNFTTDYKGLSFRYLGDFYMNENRSGYNKILQQTEPLKFNSSFWDLHYNWKISKRFSVVPQLKYKEQTPWKVHGIVSPEDIEYFKDVKKPSGSVILHYEARKNINVDGGAEYYVEKAYDHSDGGTFCNGKSYIQYYNSDFYLQGLWSNKIANLTLGTRYHINNCYDPSFVPRIGITKVIRKAHFKLLYSMAFRNPSIENIRLGRDIQPEKTNVAEIETGYQFSDNSYLTANIFDITTRNAIVYYYNGGDAYHNSGSTGTRGFEIDYKYKNALGYADFNIAYYTARGKEKSENYLVPTNTDMLLAFPGLVANGLVNIRLSDRISLNPSLSWIGSRYEIAGLDAEGNNIFKKRRPELIANVFAGLQQYKVKGLSVSAGCANIFNSKNRFIQPYNSNHAPLPGRSREFRVTLRYDLDQSKK